MNTRKVLINTIIMLGSIMLLILAKKGCMDAATQNALVIRDVAEGIALNSVPFGSRTITGFCGL